MRSREKAYEILSIRAFGKPSEKMLRSGCLTIRHLEINRKGFLQPHGKKRPGRGRIHFSVLFARDGSEVSGASAWGMYEC
ncbi:hypothetical protein Y696_05375 [Mesotoga sp. H07pep.5.4]|nr:hypothetical protein Y696_05375 [Mesotoga sp. H07pep.5.4]